MNNLSNLHEWLKTNCHSYISIIGVGSFVTGDSYIEGRSDKDYLVVFDKILDKDISKLKEYLSNTDFNDVYGFVPMEKDYFLKNKKHSHDFSGKFRTKTLFGEDIIKDKQIPSKDEAYKIINEGVADVMRRLYRILVNENIWSESKIRNISWKLYKHSFMYLAIKIYQDTKIYPKTRIEVVKQLKSKELDKTLNRLNNIDNSNKQEIIETNKKLLDYLNFFFQN